MRAPRLFSGCARRRRGTLQKPGLLTSVPIQSGNQTHHSKSVESYLPTGTRRRNSSKKFSSKVIMNKSLLKGSSAWRDTVNNHSRERLKTTRNIM
jgi:hypothetical protein